MPLLTLPKLAMCAKQMTATFIYYAVFCSDDRHAACVSFYRHTGDLICLTHLWIRIWHSFSLAARNALRRIVHTVKHVQSWVWGCLRCNQPGDSAVYTESNLSVLEKTARGNDDRERRTDMNRVEISCPLKSEIGTWGVRVIELCQILMPCTERSNIC